MSYLDLVMSFWQKDIEFNFSTTEVALYFFILKTANVNHWKNPFGLSNAIAMAKFGIGKSAFDTAKRNLKVAGLIDFKAGDGRGNVYQYWLTADGKPIVFQQKGTEKGYQKRTLSDNLSDTLSPTLSDTLSPAKPAPAADSTAPLDIEVEEERKEEPSRADAQAAFLPEAPKPPFPVPVHQVPPVAINPNRPKHAPTWDHVESYFTMQGKPEAAVKFFDHYESNGWLDAQGRPVQWWVSKANTWMSNDAEKQHHRDQRQSRADQKTAEKQQAEQSKPTLKTPEQLLAEREAIRRNRANQNQQP